MRSPIIQDNAAVENILNKFKLTGISLTAANHSFALLMSNLKPSCAQNFLKFIIPNNSLMCSVSVLSSHSCLILSVSFTTFKQISESKQYKLASDFSLFGVIALNKIWIKVSTEEQFLMSKIESVFLKVTPVVSFKQVITIV